MTARSSVQRYKDALDQLERLKEKLSGANADNDPGDAIAAEIEAHGRDLEKAFESLPPGEQLATEGDHAATMGYIRGLRG